MQSKHPGFDFTKDWICALHAVPAVLPGQAPAMVARSPDVQLVDCAGGGVSEPGLQPG
jgi:hypothetical protein